jgi:PAS domain S-box-containing protein
VDGCRLLFDTNPAPMWVFDATTLRFLDVNDAAVAQYGYSRDEYRRMTLADLRPADARATLQDDVENARKGVTQGESWPQLRKDGTTILVRVSIEDIPAEGRHARLMLVEDVGAPGRMALEFQQKQLFMQSILDELPAVAFAQDRDGRFLLVNAAWERFTGIARRDAVGKTVHDVFPKDVADRLRRADEAILAGQPPSEAELSFPSEQGPRTYITQLFPLRGEGGRIDGLVGLALDITERKRAEEHQARLSRVVEQATESIVVTDPGGTIVYVNPAFERVTGYSSSEAIGQNSRILKSGHQDAAFYRRMWDALAGGEIWKGLLVNRHKNGSLFQEEASIGPVRDAAGRLVSYVAVKRDVTNEMNLERQLMQAQKMEAVGRLAGGVAHDFNNLLGVITGYGELTRRTLSDDDPRSVKVDQILKAAERAAGLTRQLLAFSRKQVLQPTTVDLNRVVVEVEKLLRRLIGEDIQLEVVAGQELRRVRVDVGQIEQVLMNLAVNARDAMPDGGRLTIETANADLDSEFAQRHPPAQSGPYVMLAVTDNGVGMDAKTQAHLFEPFFTTKELGRGTGLGLSTVYGIVKQSEGYIWCDSEVGVGTTFRVYLPRVADEAAPTPVRAPSPLKKGTETLLLIEDDPALRELLCESLGAGGYTVLVADGGARAMEIAQEYAGAIQLIVTDVIMPGLTGRQAAEQIKASRAEVEILFISGYTDDAIVRHGVLEPGARFLSKPFTPDALLTKVREVLDGR